MKNITKQLNAAAEAASFLGGFFSHLPPEIAHGWDSVGGATLTSPHYVQLFPTVFPGWTREKGRESGREIARRFGGEWSECSGYWEGRKVVGGVEIGLVLHGISEPVKGKPLDLSAT